MSNNPTFLKNTTECTQRNNFPIEKEIDRIILSLMNKGLSPAGISRHLKEIGIPDIKPHKIREVLLKYVPKIEKINRKFDEIASRSISIVEWDETFKGHKYKVLVVLDSITGYVFLVERIAERSADRIKDILAPLKSALR